MNKVKLKYFFRDLFRRQGEKKPDQQLIWLVGFLTVFGLIMVFSAGVAVGWQKFNDSYWFVKHQIIFGLIPGLIFFAIFAKIDYFKLKSLAVPMLVFSIILLILVYITGVGSGYGTARSWINFFGFSLLPSDIVILTFLIFFVAGGSLIHLSWLSAAGFLGLWLMIKFSPYRADRLNTFLHPELDPQGIGYHINQALLAVGSGGFWGKGFGHSRQKFAYLPEVAGDSIFAVIAEELGFVISVLLVIIFIILMLKVFKIAQKCPEPFGKFLAIGIVSWFTIQAFINIGSIIGLLPMTGIPLPFVSYGGTALMTSLAAAGILVNISKQVDLD